MANSRIRLLVGGVLHTFDMERHGRVILDVAGARGIELPVQCHVGWCLECRCRLVGGEVQMSNQVALDPADRAAGFVLACCSRPISEEVSLDFDVPARES
jgi:ring-1,2-phenylacetyl-CoA epoxidase subunit PaaE